ncbi:chemotaxis protein CheW [Xylophilus sp. Leaf220]|uniref:chemotaxis protein CheW n=1 Tax=Xylophilus sp. Leaf220 TaxID=1735686 RepID=UPI0006F30E21|nr:chemotaxis protein CheW [Xylophilus sp. Leaf220]KQM69685.1 chemotaxis protein [Xylophilus sp. Leaf220]
MSDVHQESAGGAGADFDLSQFYEIFFEEAGENLDQMEQMLLDLDLSAADDEELNGIFRCAHSIKGGAATFGFADVAELTHQMESLLDRLRRHELQPVPAMVDVLLESADASRSLLARHQAGGAGESLDTSALVRRIAALAAGEVPAAAPVAAPAPAPAPAPVAAAPAPAPVAAAPAAAVEPGGTRSLEIRIGPLDNPGQADALRELFRDIPGLGTIETLPSSSADTRVFAVETTSSDEDLLDLFVFHVAKEQVRISVRGAAAAEPAPAPAAAPAAEGPHDNDPDLVEAAIAAKAPFGFFHDAPGSPIASYGLFDGAPGAPASAGGTAKPAEGRAPTEAAGPKPGAQAQQLEATTIRVGVSKVDQLINLVGELVITQAMLAQNSQGLDPAAYQQLLSGLADLDRNTRDLQESVMSIRMIPMSTVFSRFPRMLRDLATKLGKKVDFVTQGEATELDKGLVEKITDPLTHLVRNSCDHGIEPPEQRLAAGKSENGTITLSASHQGGSIVIEVRDDGRGLNRDKILSKARERGIEVSDQMTDGDVWGLIFAPGFSTADVVTDVSGRGVGMDVVKKNITALGGSVEIDSAEGYGMKVSVRLPLTLAIMDGMSVRVAGEVYILPLASVIESFQVDAAALNTIAQGSQLVKVRDDYMPVVALEKVFQIPRDPDDKDGNIMVVVESDGSRVSLLVDELLGQHQVVVKNLESNYRRVPNISGATILGDGKVALILDTSGLVRRARH